MTAINPVTDLDRDGGIAVITLNNPPVTPCQKPCAKG